MLSEIRSDRPNTDRMISDLRPPFKLLKAGKSVIERLPGMIPNRATTSKGAE
jgi:hypothetical protein